MKSMNLAAPSGLGALAAMVKPSNQPIAPSFGTTKSTGSFIAFLERAAEPDQ